MSTQTSTLQKIFVTYGPFGPVHEFEMMRLTGEIPRAARLVRLEAEVIVFRPQIGGENSEEIIYEGCADLVFVTE